MRVFGSDNWDVFELRSQLGIVSADLHQRFVAGNSEGRISGEAAVLSGFLASDGVLRYGTITGEMKQKAADALARMGASHLARRWLDELSSGEARRVLLARALVTSPRALVLDEPTTGLDLVARHDFMERVRQIARDGTTLILITHHIDEIVPEIRARHPAERGTHRDGRHQSVGAHVEEPERPVRRADRDRGERRLPLCESLAKPPVGVIGLGIMGSAMAANLVRAKYRVIGYDVLEARRRALRRAGGQVARDCGEVARQAGVVICSLPSSEALRQVAGELAAARRPKLVVVETSTLPIAVKEAARRTLAAARRDAARLPAERHRVAGAREGPGRPGQRRPPGVSPGGADPGRVRPRALSCRRRSAPARR